MGTICYFVNAKANARWLLVAILAPSDTLDEIVPERLGLSLAGLSLAANPSH
jgi:hypothetical protein